jgi:hypothetical protein
MWKRILEFAGCLAIVSAGVAVVYSSIPNPSQTWDSGRVAVVSASIIAMLLAAVGAVLVLFDWGKECPLAVLAGSPAPTIDAERSELLAFQVAGHEPKAHIGPVAAALGASK